MHCWHNARSHIARSHVARSHIARSHIARMHALPSFKVQASSACALKLGCCCSFARAHICSTPLLRAHYASQRRRAAAAALPPTAHPQAAQHVLGHAAGLVAGDPERLADYGGDRTYSAFQCLANTNLPRILAHEQAPAAALMQVRPAWAMPHHTALLRVRSSPAPRRSRSSCLPRLRMLDVAACICSALTVPPPPLHCTAVAAAGAAAATRICHQDAVIVIL